ncbi:MAG: tetratricopeptide repeat protein, partial [Gemmatimonadaceae bacterium]
MAESGRLDELKRKFDENPRRYFAPLANEYRKAGDPDRAIELCRTYLPQQPSHMSGYIVYGQALFDANRSDEAAGVFKQALTLDPENVIAFRYLGDIARSKRDSAGAMRWYGKILELDPRNEEISAQITALATPSSRPIPRNERVAPPTIRPEPKYDASAVALSELVSEPDKHQPERARPAVEPAHGAQAEPAPVP